MRLITRMAGAAALVLMFTAAAFAQVTTRSVRGTIRKPDGSAWSGATVKFTLDKSTYTATDSFPAAVVTATTNASGKLCVAPCSVEGVTLWANAEGTVKTLYTVTLPDASTFQFRLSLGDGSAVDITTLRAAGVTPLTSADPAYVTLQAFVATHAAAADPHAVYLTEAEGDARYAPLDGGGGVTDHGALTGLADDDHTQYFNQARGDARYYTQAQLDAFLAAKAAVSHGHVIADVTGMQPQLDAKAASGHSHADATTSASGFMSGADKTKLDGVQTGATANSTDAQLRDRSTHTGAQAISTVTGLQAALDSKLAAASNLSDLGSAATARTNLGLGTAATKDVAASGDASTAQVVKGDDTRLIDSRTPTGGAGGVLSGSYPSPGFAVDMATQGELDSETSARLAGDLNSQPSDSDLTAIAALSPSNDDLLQRKGGAWTNRTPAQVKTDLALSKADVGLANADNTADSAKPVSTAQQAALDLKANLVSPAFTTPNIGAATGTSLALGTNPATTGAVRLANNTYVFGRRSDNSNNHQLLGLDSSNQVALGNASNNISLAGLWVLDVGTGAMRNAGGYPLGWSNQGAFVSSAASGIVEINNGTNGTYRDLRVRQHYVDATMTSAGTTGAQTINKAAGSVNFAAGATSLVVTNNLVTTSSIVMATIQTDDATATSVKAIPAAGSFTLKLNAAATAETKVAFHVINK